MLKKEIGDIIEASGSEGWILEPRAKYLLGVAGLDVPDFQWVKSISEALAFAEKTGYPVVMKVVSPRIMHKSDVGGIVTGIDNDEKLTENFHRLSRLEGFDGVLVEEQLVGLELIIGAKMDYQFGPVILLGMGGTGVEIYKDSTLRMAPLNERDVKYMVSGLKAHKLLEGYRGSDPVNMEKLSRTIVAFSRLVMEFENNFESIDLNPVMCSSKRCVVADARIILEGTDLQSS